MGHFSKPFKMLAILALTSVGSAADWGQFRGPRGTAVADGELPPLDWSSNENIRWKVALPGRGVSSPVVAGNYVFITAASGYEERRLHVFCFEFDSGRKVWERQFWATGSTMRNPRASMAGATPATDGERVYALFATGDLACLNSAGDLVWYRSLCSDYPRIQNQVGMAASPVLWKNVLLLPMENAGDSFAAGLDKFTGKNLWRVDRFRDINWATPLVIDNGGRQEALFQTAKDLTAYDPQTGRLRWSFSGGAPVSSPIAGDGLVFVPGDEFSALRPPAEGAAPEVIWKNNRIRTVYPSALFYRGRIYGINPAGILGCAEARSGNLLWQHRLNGTFWASPVAAEGHLYALDGEGTTTVIDVTGPEPRVVAMNALDEAMFATPAIARKRILVRSHQHLYCIGR